MRARSRLLPLLGLLPVLATACPPDEPDASEIIGNWAAGTNLDFEVCGTVEAGQCGEWTPSAADVAAVTCFTDGLAACLPVRMTQSRPTVEGDPIRETFFVVPAGGDCDVVRFVDTTDDAFGPQQVYRYDCAAATADASCGGLQGDGCGDWVAMW